MNQTKTEPFSLKEAIALGEYQPETLSKYPEWEKLSGHAQFELISQGLETRSRQLFKKWSEIVNFINDSDNPTLQDEAKQNIERQIKTLREDKERLYLEYSKLT